MYWRTATIINPKAAGSLNTSSRTSPTLSGTSSNPTTKQDISGRVPASAPATLRYASSRTEIGSVTRDESVFQRTSSLKIREASNANQAAVAANETQIRTVPSNSRVT